MELDEFGLPTEGSVFEEIAKGDQKIKVTTDIRRYGKIITVVSGFDKNVDIKNLSQKIVEPHKGVIKTDPFPVIPSAYLIDKVGLKGKKEGDAQISPKHPNFIVNNGGAKAKDVLKLIALGLAVITWIYVNGELIK